MRTKLVSDLFDWNAVRKKIQRSANSGSLLPCSKTKACILHKQAEKVRSDMADIKASSLSDASQR